MTERDATERRTGLGSTAYGIRTQGTVTVGEAFPLVMFVLSVGTVVAFASDGLRLLYPPLTLTAGGLLAVRSAGIVAVAAGVD